MRNGIHDFRAERTYLIDLGGKRSRSAVLAALGEGLKLPSHYGNNFDALADCLMDGDWAKQDTITVVLAGSTSAARALKTDWETLTEIFEEACQWWAERGRTFHVLLC